MKALHIHDDQCLLILRSRFLSAAPASAYSMNKVRHTIYRGRTNEMRTISLCIGKYIWSKRFEFHLTRANAASWLRVEYLQILNHSRKLYDRSSQPRIGDWTTKKGGLMLCTSLKIYAYQNNKHKYGQKHSSQKIRTK